MLFSGTSLKSSSRRPFPQGLLDALTSPEDETCKQEMTRNDSLLFHRLPMCVRKPKRALRPSIGDLLESVNGKSVTCCSGDAGIQANALALIKSAERPVVLTFISMDSRLPTLEKAGVDFVDGQQQLTDAQLPLDTESHDPSKECFQESETKVRFAEKLEAARAEMIRTNFAPASAVWWKFALGFDARATSMDEAHRAWLRTGKTAPLRSGLSVLWRLPGTNLASARVSSAGADTAASFSSTWTGATVLVALPGGDAAESQKADILLLYRDDEQALVMAHISEVLPLFGLLSGFDEGIPEVPSSAMGRANTVEQVLVPRGTSEGFSGIEEYWAHRDTPHGLPLAVPRGPFGSSSSASEVHNVSAEQVKFESEVAALLDVLLMSQRYTIMHQIMHCF